MLYLKLQLLETNGYLRKENGGIFGLVVYFKQFPISLCFLVQLEILTVYTFKRQLIKKSVFILWNFMISELFFVDGR